MNYKIALQDTLNGDVIPNGPSLDSHLAVRAPQPKPNPAPNIKLLNMTAKKFELKNRRYLGNKHKLLEFIAGIVNEQCGDMSSFCDIFAGTGVVGAHFNDSDTTIITNDILTANYACLNTFLSVGGAEDYRLEMKINYLNSLKASQENYFSKNFGGTYFTKANARKIGRIREEIDVVSATMHEKHALICSLLYATDKVANTVGHYDAFRKNLDMTAPIMLRIPNLDLAQNVNNEIYNEDANDLIRKISCDVLYIDPPYNSRQYSDAYHLLENLAEWKKPDVVGIGKKMDRAHIKSAYCLKSAENAFANLIEHASCKHILLSYNNTAGTKDGRSNARMRDEAIMDILNKKGTVEIFEKSHKAFTTGKSDTPNNVERIFYCKVG